MSLEAGPGPNSEMSPERIAHPGQVLAMGELHGGLRAEIVELNGEDQPGIVPVTIIRVGFSRAPLSPCSRPDILPTKEIVQDPDSVIVEEPYVDWSEGVRREGTQFVSYSAANLGMVPYPPAEDPDFGDQPAYWEERRYLRLPEV